MQVVVPHQVMGRRSKTGRRRAALATSLLIACSCAAALVALLGYTHVDENAAGHQQPSLMATKSEVIHSRPFQMIIEI
jgi:hypothetical protein